MPPRSRDLGLSIRPICQTGERLGVQVAATSATLPSGPQPFFFARSSPNELEKNHSLGGCAALCSGNMLQPLRGKGASGEGAGSLLSPS